MLPRLAGHLPVVCIAPGPSLTAEDVAYVRGNTVVIAVNDAVRLAPWADLLHSSDQIWWQQHYREMRSFPGIKTRVSPSLQAWRTPPSKHHCPGCRRRIVSDKACWCEGIITLGNAGHRGLSLDPTMIVTTDNSGGAAINIAVHLGAKQILLLGYDMAPDKNGRQHFHDTKPKMIVSPYQKFRKLIATMVEPLQNAGIEVVNCSRRTALECFPCLHLEEALPVSDAVAC